MAGGVEVRSEVVAARLARLVELYDQAEQLRKDCTRMREAQAGAWPEIASVQKFSARYQSSIADVEAQLGDVQGTIGHFRQALVDSTTALQRQDEDIQLRLRQLAERLDTPSAAGSTTVTPAAATTPATPNNASY